MANKQLIDFISAENDLDGNEPVYIAQGGKTRKTLLQKIKEFIIGTTTMGTTATDVTGAVKELNDKIGSAEKEGSITAQLNEKANKSDIVNDCNTNDTTKILGADQGKYLKDYIDNINTRTLCNLQRETENLGLEQIVSPGWHICRTNVNAPESDGEFIVECINPYPSTNTFVIQHIYSLWTSKIYLRFFASGTGLWSDYKTLL